MRNRTNYFSLPLAAFLLLMFLNVCVFTQEAQLESLPGSNPLSFIGTWTVQTQITNCSGTTLESFSKMVSANAGGTAHETSSSGLFRSTAIGIWENTSRNNFVYALRFFRFNPDGTPAGSVRPKWTVLMGEAGDSYTATGAIQIVAPNGTVVANLCGSETGTRMQIPE